MKIFLVEPFNNKSLLKDELKNSPYQYLYSHLKDRGIDLHTVDLRPLETADKIIFFNHNKNLLTDCERLGVGKEKRVLVLWEPETVIPDQYKKSVWGLYGEVISFREDLAKKYNFPKINWPQGQAIRSNVPDFKSRKLVTLINAHKYSYVKGELYTLRRDVIKFFQKKNEGLFDFYGMGWAKNPFGRLKIAAFYGLMALKQISIFQFMKDVTLSFFDSWPAFKGEIADKYKILDGYRFNICFENEATYITEKIFDSFSSGTIPVYKGPSEIKSLVPSDCYIDFDHFNSMDEMYDFLKSMDEKEFIRRQIAIITYMNSEQFKKMQPDAVFKKLSEVLS